MRLDDHTAWLGLEAYLGDESNIPAVGEDQEIAGLWDAAQQAVFLLLDRYVALIIKTSRSPASQAKSESQMRDLSETAINAVASLRDELEKHGLDETLPVCPS